MATTCIHQVYHITNQTEQKQIKLTENKFKFQMLKNKYFNYARQYKVKT